MERAANKADRLMQIESLLVTHPEGLTQAEIARRLGVHRSTIYRYLPDLTTRFAVYFISSTSSSLRYFMPSVWMPWWL